MTALSAVTSDGTEGPFPNKFMAEYTDFVSFDEMLSASGSKVTTQEEWAAIPDDQWDAFIAARTRFKDWKEMKGKAGAEWTLGKLSL